MKRLITIAITFLLIGSTQISVGYNSFEIILKPAWNELDSNFTFSALFQSKWILVGTITVKKRIAQEMNLDQLVLHWRGPLLENLTGSLYKKELDKPLLPLEENLICDSNWHPHLQKLIFKFNEPLQLTAHTSFCLILSVPPILESTIKEGSFVLEKNSLPYNLRKSIMNEPFTLVFN